MKRSCKHVNITDPETIRPWVVECIKRHKKRYDFRDLLLRHGLSRDAYYESLRTHDVSGYPFDSITEEAIRMIQDRELRLKPVRMKEQEDKTTRLIIRLQRRGMLTFEQSLRLVSFKGFYKFSDYAGDFKAFKKAQNIIRKGATA